MSIFVTTPPSQEGGVDGFGLFACILPSHCMYLLMCRSSSSSRYIYLYYVIGDTRMHAHIEYWRVSLAKPAHAHIEYWRVSLAKPAHAHMIRV